MEFLRSLFVRKTKSKGSEAVEETIAGFVGIIQDLNEALEETNEERIDAARVVEAAIQERGRIETTLDEGHKFLAGLKALLQG